MILNKQVCKFLGVCDEDYKAWCKQNKYPKYSKKSKQKFFEEIMNTQCVVMKNENDDIH